MTGVSVNWLALRQEQCPGQKQTSGQPGSLFLLNRITGQEGDVTQSLNSAQVVVEECVQAENESG